MILRGYKRFYSRHEAGIWLAIVLVPLAALGIGYLVAPHAVWDGFIHRYYIGPYEADLVSQQEEGAAVSYNIVDTTTYGIILMAAIFWIYRLMTRLAIRFDRWFLAAVVPYVMVGGTMRALEDSTLYSGWCNYLFIAPAIYIFIGIITILSLVACHFISIVPRGMGIAGFATLVAAADIVYIVLFLGQPDLMVYWYPPAFVIVLSIATVAIVWWLGMDKDKDRKRIDRTTTFFVFGLFLLMPQMLLVVDWYAGGATWSYGGAAQGTGLLYLELPIMLALAGIATLVIMLIGTVAARARWTWGLIFLRPENVLIMFSQFLDASATYRALAAFDYGEKHVLPNALIDATGTAAVMFPLKAIAYCACLYLIDVDLKKDLTSHPSLMYLIKVAMLVLGLAPGLRDALRVVMGI